MPIYEYQCQSCGHQLEKLQRMSDDPLKDCPACGESRLQRLVSAAAFRLKGAGWYETDFKSSNKKNLADSGAESGSGAAATTGSASDSSAKADKAAGDSKKTPAAKPVNKPAKDKSAGAA